MLYQIQSVLLTWIICVSGKLTIFPEDPLVEHFNEISETKYIKNTRIWTLLEDVVWVLDLSREVLSGDNLYLRVGTLAEEKEFAAYEASVIPQQRQKVINKDQSQNANDDMKTDMRTIKEDIIRMINKFILSTHTEFEPSISWSAFANEPLLSIYFKGENTCLTLKRGVKQWHYFINAPVFHPWFYAPFTNIQGDGEKMLVKVPVIVTGPFYKSLLHLLQNFLSFPV